MTGGGKADFLGEERIVPLLFKLGIPAAVGMLVNALYNIVDTIFVGQGVGSLAIAALAIVFPIQILVSAFAQALGAGAASIMSRRLGEKRPEDAARTAGGTLGLVTGITILLSVLLVRFSDPILRFFGASTAILPYARDYIHIVGSGFPLFALSMAASTLLRAEGNTKASMLGMVLGAGLNCLLDPLLIFAIPMGVKGAAIATVISQLASTVFLLQLYVRKKTVVRIAIPSLKPRWSIFRESAVLGIPSFVQSAGMSLLALIMNNNLGRYGGDQAITIYGMVHRLLSIVILPLIGIAQGFQPVAGYNYGARRYDRVKAALRDASLIALGVALLGWAVMQVFPEGCMGLFTPEADLRRAAAKVLRVMVLLIPTAAFQIIGSNYFLAVGKPMRTFVLSLLRQFILLIPLALILPIVFGLGGIWWAFPLADVASACITMTVLFFELRHLDEKHAARGLEGRAVEPRS